MQAKLLKEITMKAKLHEVLRVTTKTTVEVVVVRAPTPEAAKMMVEYNPDAFTTHVMTFTDRSRPFEKVPEAAKQLPDAPVRVDHPLVNVVQPYGRDNLTGEDEDALEAEY